MSIKKIAWYGRRTLLYVFLLGLACVTILPILYTFFASFKSNHELLVNGSRMLPKVWQTENYVQAWILADFKRYTWNSVYMSAIVVVGVTIVSAMGGYVFARGEFPGKKLIFTLFTSLMFISLGTVTLYPKMEIAKLLHINRTLWGVIIIYLFGLHITNFYIVRGFINSIPKELDEAAQIDGCSFFGIFIHIMLPVIKPIMATIAIITFKTVWNDYLMPMVFTIGTPSQMPLVVGLVNLKNTGEGATSWNLMMAGCMISIVPMLVIYLILNRQFVEGITAGSVKG